MIVNIVVAVIYRPVIHPLLAIIDSSIIIGMLAIIRVTSIVRCVSATIVDGLSLSMSDPSIVGTIVHIKISAADIQVLDILEEVGFHHCARTGRNSKRVMGNLIRTQGQTQLSMHVEAV